MTKLLNKIENPMSPILQICHHLNQENPYVKGPFLLLFKYNLAEGLNYVTQEVLTISNFCGSI